MEGHFIHHALVNLNYDIPSHIYEFKVEIMIYKVLIIMTY